MVRGWTFKPRPHLPPWVIQTELADQIVLCQQVDQAAFTPIRPASTPYYPIYIWVNGLHYNRPLKLTVLDRLGTKERASLTCDIGPINRNQLVHDTFNSNNGHNQSALVSSKNNVDIHVKVMSDFLIDFVDTETAECWKNHIVVLQHPGVSCENEVSLLLRGDIHTDFR